MAAPMARLQAARLFSHLRSSNTVFRNGSINNKLNLQFQRAGIRTGPDAGINIGLLSKYRRGLILTGGFVAGFAVTYTWVSKNKDVFAAQEETGLNGVKKSRPEAKLSRVIKSATDDTGLKLTLYQYQTCPFCCKVRAFLDYYGFAYNVVEVNSVTRKQVKWSDYKKVPILVCEDMDKDGFLQLNDSSVIISILESYLEDRNVSIEKLLTYYPAMESKNDKGKTVLEFPNKYFIMYGEKKPLKTAAQMKEERNWRDWVEKDLVHMLSPNVYRTPREALQAFKYFSEVGQWEQNFSTTERYTVIYVGATVMYFLGKYLKYKYCKLEPRESLYDSLNTWVKAVGKEKKFMGGDAPNLADLSVYGVLCSIEGCDAWKDALQNTRIKRWFNDTKAAVDSHGGAQLMATKGAWSK